jgi:CubicO group peptidase (beta-lactamase class C family)
VTINPRHILSLLLATLLGVAFAQAEPGLEEEMDSYLQAHVATGRFMGTVLVARGDEVLFERAYGMADLELGAPNTPRTRYKVGSLTKQFTAALILKVQEEGRLSVEDTLATYLPDFPRGEEITVHQLLNHTAGVFNYTNSPDLPQLARQELTLDELIATFADRPLDFEPGTNFNYSNSGYILLTKIIEVASGMSYGDYLRTLLEPLDVASLEPYSLREITPERASGYALAEGGLENALFIDPSIPAGAGNMIATAHDLYRWNRALMTGELLSEASREAMFSGGVAVDPMNPSLSYTYGWFAEERFGRPAIGHGGGIFGFSAMNSFYPEDDLIVIVLGNIEVAPSDRIAQDLAAIVLGEAYELPALRTAIELGPEVLERYVGVYELMPDVTLTISLDEGRLYGQLTGQPRFELVPESEAEFFLQEVDAQVHFEVDEAGNATGLVLYQGGQAIPASRLE